jgi:hypothetical protein
LFPRVIDVAVDDGSSGQSGTWRLQLVADDQ